MMLSGYFKNPDLLKIYLIRNQQIAERDNFLSLVEFYDNCNIKLENVKKQISDLYNDRKKELYLILSDQKTKNKDTSGIQKEINFLKPDNFQIPLLFITNQQFRGHLSYSDIEFIENTIRQIFVYVDSKEPYKIEYNEDKYYYDTSENKLYTGIDFYRKSYFRSDKIEFPYNCPDLIPEYYEISLQKYKEDEKQKSSVMFNEIEVTKEFINLELTRNNILIKGLSDAINRVKNIALKSKSKIQLVKYCKRYDRILNNKLDEIKQPQQTENKKPDEVKKELHNNIFKDDAFEIWQSMFEKFEIIASKRTDIDFMFQVMKYNNLIFDTIGYVDIQNWINEVYEIVFEKIKYTDHKARSNEKRLIIYNDIISK
jgi:hypothetical protein